MKEIDLLIEDIKKEIYIKEMPSKYLYQFYKLLTLTELKDVLRELKKYDIKEGAYKRNLESLRRLFPNREKGIKYLEYLYEEYKKSLKHEQVEDLNYYLNVAKKVLETGYSIEEYCAVTGEYRVYELKEIIAKIKLEYNSIYRELEILEHVNKRRFLSYVRSVVLEMQENDNFDLFDYYYLTKMHPTDFLTVVNRVMPDMEKTKIKYLLRKFSDKLNYKVNKEVELEGKTIISEREITREEKEKIFNMLENLNIPNATYKIVLRRYINNDEKILEYLDMKSKVKNDKRY